MDIRDACEQAYKNGYKDAYARCADKIKALAGCAECFYFNTEVCKNCENKVKWKWKDCDHKFF